MEGATTLHLLIPAAQQGQAAEGEAALVLNGGQGQVQATEKGGGLTGSFRREYEKQIGQAENNQQPVAERAEMKDRTQPGKENSQPETAETSENSAAVKASEKMPNSAKKCEKIEKKGQKEAPNRKDQDKKGENCKNQVCPRQKTVNAGAGKNLSKVVPAGVRTVPGAEGQIAAGQITGQGDGIENIGQNLVSGPKTAIPPKTQAVSGGMATAENGQKGVQFTASAVQAGGKAVAVEQSLSGNSAVKIPAGNEVPKDSGSSKNVDNTGENRVLAVAGDKQASAGVAIGKKAVEQAQSPVQAGGAPQKGATDVRQTGVEVGVVAEPGQGGKSGKDAGQVVDPNAKPASSGAEQLQADGSPHPSRSAGTNSQVSVENAQISVKNAEVAAKGADELKLGQSDLRPGERLPEPVMVFEHLRGEPACVKEADAEAILPPRSGQVVEQVEQGVLMNLSQAAAGRQITIRLDPPELGKVTVKFVESARGGELTAVMEVSKPETRAEIQQAIPELLRNLAEAGIRIRKVDIQADISEQASTGREGAGEGLQNQQQAWQRGQNASPAGSYPGNGSPTGRSEDAPAATDHYPVDSLNILI